MCYIYEALALGLERFQTNTSTVPLALIVL